jgi:tetratricopeptide (TPR) repeat protein
LKEQSAKHFTNVWDRLSPNLAVVAVVLLAAWLGDKDGGYFVGDWTPAAMVVAVLLFVISAAGMLFYNRVGNKWSVLALGLLAAYTAWTFASLLWSPNRGDAWLGAGQTFFYLLAFWVVVALLGLGASRRWALAASVLGPAVIAAFTLPALGPRLGEMFENNRLIGSLTYYNGEAAFLLVPLWAAIYLGGSRRVHPVLRGAVLAGAVLNVDLAVLTQSRGAMVALAVSLPVFFLLSGQRLRGLLALTPIAAALFVAFPDLNGVYLAFLNESDAVKALNLALPTVWLTAGAAGLYGVCWGLLDRWWRPPVVAVRIVGGVALAGCMVILIAGAVELNERYSNPAALAQQKWEAFKTSDSAGRNQSRYLSASGSGRYELWRVAWEDFTAHPVLGVGTQNYEATYYQLREQQNVQFVRQPHSLPLEVVGERGVVGGGLFAGFLAVCLGVGLSKRFGGRLSSEGKAQIGALVAAVTYWFAHSSADWFWQIPAVTLPAFVYLAMLVSPWGRDEPAPLGWPLRATGIGVAVLAVAAFAPLYAADRYLEKSQASKNPREALLAVERAQEFNPLNPRLPVWEAQFAMQTGDYNRAERSYALAIRLNPEHYAPYANKARFYVRRGEPEAALVYYRKARALNPLDPGLKKHVGRLKNTTAPDDEQ